MLIRKVLQVSLDASRDNSIDFLTLDPEKFGSHATEIAIF
jgi:hypothetical protein